MTKEQVNRLSDEGPEARFEPLDIFDDEERNIWSGFITRNKQNRVQIDAFSVSGDRNEQFLPDRLHNLNLTMRGNYEDIDKHECQG